MSILFYISCMFLIEIHRACLLWYIFFQAKTSNGWFTATWYFSKIQYRSNYNFIYRRWLPRWLRFYRQPRSLNTQALTNTIVTEKGRHLWEQNVSFYLLEEFWKHDLHLNLFIKTIYFNGISNWYFSFKPFT